MFIELCRNQLIAYRTRNSNRMAYRSLCQLDDHLLQDIGLNRPQIATSSIFETACKMNTREAHKSKIEISNPRNFGWPDLVSVVGIRTNDKKYS